MLNEKNLIDPSIYMFPRTNEINTPLFNYMSIALNPNQVHTTDVDYFQSSSSPIIAELSSLNMTLITPPKQLSAPAALIQTP